MTEVTKPCGRKILYFCPATMIGNVERECRQWAPHRSVVELGGKTKIQRAFLLDLMKGHPEYVVICNYEAWRKDLGLIDELIDIEFDTVIIDEAHNVKDIKGVAYKGIKRIISESNYGQGIPFVFPMTGTPILNRPQEFFALLSLVDRKHFNNERYFLLDYCQQDYNTQKWIFKPGGAQTLFKKFPNLFLRRTKEQAGIVLPPKTIIEHNLEVDTVRYPKQAEARDQMRKWGSILLDPDKGEAITAMAQIAVFTRLRQIETWPAAITVKDAHGDVVLSLGDEYGESQKIDEIIHYENSEVNEWQGLLPEVCYNPTTGEGERSVAFSQFKIPLHIMAERAQKAGYRSVVLDGDTSESVREEIAKDFDARYTPDPSKSKWDVVFCNYKVGGVGLNFTAATQMFILDEEWNPGKRDQAYDRIHRMGQDKPVTIHLLRTKGTIDKWLADIIEQKEALVEGFEASAMSLTSSAYDALKNGLI